MRWLIFLSRVAFLTGLFMILAFSLLFITWNRDETVSSTIIMAGYGLAVVILPLVVLLYLVLTMSGKKPFNAVPRWLFFCNLLFLVILLVFSFYVNDPYYHQ